MGFMKRAFLYVTRKRGKTVLLFAILLIMATFVLTGLSIWKASDVAQAELRQALGGQFDIFVDWNNSPYVVKEMVQDNEVDESGVTINSFLMYSTKQLTPDDLTAIKSTPGVKYCTARYGNMAPFDGLSLLPGTVPVSENIRGWTNIFSVCGTEEDELFTTGTFTLTDGRHITADDRHVAVISRDLAERNDLQIGDTITTRIYNAAEQAYTGDEIPLQVIGLFTPNNIEKFGEAVTDYDKVQNRVFTDFQTGPEISGDNINYGFSEVRVTVIDPQDMDKTVSAVKALPMIDWEAFTVNVDNDTYEKAAAPLATLSELVMVLLVVIIVVSAVILALILTLWTKTRIHEIGVFLSVGIKKSAIIGQYLVEVLLVAVLAFGLSYFTSNAVAGQIGNHLLEQNVQAETADEGLSATANAAVAGEVPLLQKPLPTETGIEISVGADDLAQLVLIGLAVIVVAVSISSITVMRLKPREILSKMS